MKVTIDRSIPKPSKEEIEAITEAVDTGDIPEVDDVGFREAVKGCKEVIIPGHVVEQLDAAGISLDEFSAILLKAAGKLT